MQFVLLALGSRGDVQPFVALARALEARGHRAVVAATEDYRDLVESYQVAFAPVGYELRSVIFSDRVNHILATAHNPARFARHFVGEVGPFVDRMMADLLQATRDADVLVASTIGAYFGLSLAERLHIPLVQVHMHPLTATGTNPHIHFPSSPHWLPRRELYNRFTYVLGTHGLWQMLRRPLNRARVKVLDLPPLSPVALIRRVRPDTTLTLYAYSACVAPPPDSRTDLHVTGYWFLERLPDFQPDPVLVDFLRSGPPPVYIGFGSVPVGQDPDRFTALCVDALQQAGQRGLLYGGWGDWGRISLPDSVLPIGLAPHDWLFPRVAAAVHHGGAGTTAAALRAGIPCTVVPFFGDQLFWGQRVHALGVGPEPIHRSRLSSEALAKAIRQMGDDPSMRERARSIGASIEREDGIENAIDCIERNIVSIAV